MSSSKSVRADASLWDKLEVGRVYVLLFVRSHPPKADDFHWGIYGHTEKKGGRKYHIKTLGNGWIADHGPTSGVFKSFLLVGLFHIATIPAEQTWFDYLDGIMRTYDNQLNAPGTLVEFGLSGSSSFFRVTTSSFVTIWMLLKQKSSSLGTSTPRTPLMESSRDRSKHRRSVVDLSKRKSQLQKEALFTEEFRLQV